MGSLRWACGVAFAALVASSLPVACGGDPFSAGSSPNIPNDASTIDGPVGDVFVADVAADTTSSIDAGIVLDAADATSEDGSSLGKTVFVSTATGDDTRTGLDPLRPKKTIVSALAVAAVLGPGAAVHVCAGNYAETALVVGSDVSLLGSYDCVTWARTATYGYPKFDGKNQSVVTNADATKQSATLVVQGTVTAATTVDGFSIAGSTSAASVTYGIDVEGAASPVLSNDVVAGGSGKASSALWGSIGVRIGGSSSAELTLSAVSGGSGEAATGSLGVLIQSTGAPYVHGDVVSGGTGVSNGAMPDLASVGVAVLSTLATGKPLANVIVAGADSTGVAGSSVGVLVEGTTITVQIADCEIQGGTGMDTSTTSAGIDVEATGTVSLVANRIYGGTRKGATSQTYGIKVGSAATVTIANSEIHAGSAGSGTGSYAVGVNLLSGASPSIVDDTIYTGAGSNAIGVEVASVVTGATLTGDLFVGGGATSSDDAIVGGQCSGVFSAVDYCAFVNFPFIYQCTSSPTNQVATDPSMLATVLGSSVTTKGNVELMACASPAASWCAQDMSCPSTPPAACAQSVFGVSWTSSDDGVTGLFSATGADGGATVGGWTLEPGSSCAISKGGTTVGSITTDLFGTQRGSTPSIGAVQYTSTSSCSM